MRIGRCSPLNELAHHRHAPLATATASAQDAVRSARLRLGMSSRKKKLSVAERTEAEARRAAAQRKQDANQRMADMRAGDRVAELMAFGRTHTLTHTHAHSHTLTHSRTRTNAHPHYHLSTTSIPGRRRWRRWGAHSRRR